MQLEHLRPSLGHPGMQSLSLWLIRPRQHRLPDASMINTLLKPHYTAFHDWLAQVAHVTPNEVIWCHAIFISSSHMQPTLSNLQKCYSNLEIPDWISVSLLLISVVSYHFNFGWPVVWAPICQLFIPANLSEKFTRFLFFFRKVVVGKQSNESYFTGCFTVSYNFSLL